jgi:hypothetical protein
MRTHKGTSARTVMEVSHPSYRRWRNVSAVFETRTPERPRIPKIDGGDKFTRGARCKFIGITILASLSQGTCG